MSGYQIDALIAIQTKQPEALKIAQDNGFIFKDIGREPGNWQHLAFTYYTMLCEVETIARQALEEAGLFVGDTTE